MTAEVPTAVPLEELVKEARERAIERYAQTIGRPLEKARESYALAEQGLKCDPQFEMGLLKQELRLLPLFQSVSRLCPQGEISVSPQGLIDVVRDQGIRMHPDEVILTFGRLAEKQKRLEDLSNSFTN